MQNQISRHFNELADKEHEKDGGVFQPEKQFEYHSVTEHTNETRRHAAGSRQLRDGSQERNSDNSSLHEEHSVNVFTNSCLAHLQYIQ